jgi:hypothetical protein
LGAGISYTAANGLIIYRPRWSLFVHEMSMKAYYLFLRANVPYVGFGWLLTFFSSYGQTFLISL